MKQKGLPVEEVEKILESAHKKDQKFENGRIMCSMYSTPHELARQAHAMFIEANLGNPNLYPGTKELEQEVIKMLSQLLHGEDVYGSIVNGGTEANITALWLAKKFSGKKEVLYPVSSHFSINKAIDLLGLDPVPIDLDEHYKMDLDQLESKISDNTAAVVAMAGSTELGVIDPIEQIAELTADKCFFHVDAAFGGLIIPFLQDIGYDLPSFDFENPGVDAMAVDPHKIGGATIPSGAFLIRDKTLLEKIAVDTPYLTVAQQSALVSTRSSASVAGTYAVLRHLGREGYCKLVSQCMEVTKYFQYQLVEKGFNIVIEPVLNLIAIEVPQASEIERQLAENNWWVSKMRNPEALRFVIMPHVTKSVVDSFMTDFVNICKNRHII